MMLFSSALLKMTLSNEAIVGIISLLIMCFPVLRFLKRLFHPHNSHALIPLELVPGPDELGLLEAGMLYARRTVRVDTVVIRPAAMPYLRWLF
ncbi:hypothetical protein F4818DRAFT_417934 [Hypoxylon cercidicola]|nr:hypothetical protein F4818DRAFT_417934 [Hypoxylon cercidicola]